MNTTGKPYLAKAHLNIGHLMAPAEFTDYCKTFSEGPHTREAWALTTVLPDAVVQRFKRPREHVAADVLWLASPRDAVYVGLAMQVGDVQLRAYAPLFDRRVAEWAGDVRRQRQLSLAVEVEPPRRLAIFVASCTSRFDDAIEQALTSSRVLSKEERAYDLVEATKRMCLPSAIPTLIPGQSIGELYVIAVQCEALKQTFSQFGLSDATGE